MRVLANTRASSSGETGRASVTRRDWALRVRRQYRQFIFEILKLNFSYRVNTAVLKELCSEDCNFISLGVTPVDI